MNNKERLLFSAVATLIGTVIGAGFLGIPKALTLSGFIPGVFLMFFTAFATVFMCFFASELALNTGKKAQMPGLIGLYLGENVKKLALIVLSFISFGAIIAYLVACSDILSMFFGYSQDFFMILLFFFVSYFVWAGIRLVEKAELLLSFSLILFLFVMVFFVGGRFDVDKLTDVETTNLLIPFGVLIFAFGGYNVMPEIEKIVHGDKKLMIQTCVIGTFIPFMFYLTFSILMVGVFNHNIADVATESLTGIIGVIGNSIAFLAMLSSYLISGLILRDVFTEDFGINKNLSVLISMTVPFIFAFFLKPSFINVLAYTGAVLTGFFGFLVCITVIFQRKKIRMPKFTAPGGNILPIIVGLFFLAGSLILFL